MRRTADFVSLMSANARAMAVRPALERHFADPLATFDACRPVRSWHVRRLARVQWVPVDRDELAALAAVEL